MKTITDVEKVVSVLNEEQKQVLKDCINFGFWGDADYEFLDEKGNLETVMMNGYCTNDAKKESISQGARFLLCSVAFITDFVLKNKDIKSGM